MNRAGYDSEWTFEECLNDLRKIEKFRDVTEEFRALIRTVALRMMSFQDRWRCLTLCQLMQMGGGGMPGIGESRQSDNPEHIRLDFSTGAGGLGVTVFVESRIISFYDQRGRSVLLRGYLENVTVANALVDAFVALHWRGVLQPAPESEDEENL